MAVLTAQQWAADWHAARFPTCTAEDVALKAITELGEVADAVLARGRDASHPERAAGLVAEAADVVVTMLTLVGRYTDGDLLAAVDAKLSTLTTPGAHAASLPEGTEL